jgi:hypothetical protein
MIALMSMEDGQVWVLIIGAITTPILTAIGLVIAHLNNKATVQQRNRVENEVKIVKHNTNAALGESFRVAMISAHLLAAQQPTDEYKKLAKEAEDKYLHHEKQMTAGAVEEAKQSK